MECDHASAIRGGSVLNQAARDSLQSSTSVRLYRLGCLSSLAWFACSPSIFYVKPKSRFVTLISTVLNQISHPNAKSITTLSMTTPISKSHCYTWGSAVCTHFRYYHVKDIR